MGLKKLSEPGWVGDDELWQHAKASALKSYDQDDPVYWPVVTAIYKKMGGSIEADGGAGFGQVLRQTESNAKPVKAAFRLQESTTFREAVPQTPGQTPNPSRFTSVIIQEGMGNFRDGFYYTREALDSAVQLFEGKKIYADHPTEIEEKIIPERSVRDILGHFENVKVVEAQDGHSTLEADLVILPEPEFDWARGLMKHAIEYNKKFPTRDFVGLSINANGQAEAQEIEAFVEEKKPPEYCMKKLQAALDGGIKEIRVVSKLTDAISCDLVTEAGAGGRLIKMIEGELMKPKKKTKESDQAHPASGKGPTQEADGHDDAAQDKELIKSMLKKHMGGDSEPSEEDLGMAKECMDTAKEMGYEGEEAEKAAVAGMKMMKKIGEKYAKQAEGAEKKEGEAEEKKEGETEAKPKESAKPKADPGDEDDEEEKSPETPSEAIKENLKLRGELASTQQKLRRFEITEYLDKKLSESGEERKVTNVFREGLKIDEIKSTKEIDTRWGLFIEAYRAGRREADPNDMIISVPKRGGETGKNGLDLSDCVG